MQVAESTKCAATFFSTSDCRLCNAAPMSSCVHQVRLALEALSINYPDNLSPIRESGLVLALRRAFAIGFALRVFLVANSRDRIDGIELMRKVDVHIKPEQGDVHVRI